MQEQNFTMGICLPEHSNKPYNFFNEESICLADDVDIEKVSIRIKNHDPIFDIKEAAMNTVGKKWFEGKDLTEDLWFKYLISEHSPIRSLDLRISFDGILYYNSVHYARHVHSIPYVTTHRPDRTKRERTINDRVVHKADINSQGLMDMFRKRLCVGSVDKITHKIGVTLKTLMMNSDNYLLSQLGRVLVPNCIYRGGANSCPEFKECGLCNNLSNLEINSIKNRYDEYNKMMKK